MKKSIALDLLDALYPLVNKNLHRIRVTQERSDLVSVTDIDPDSDFFFNIEKRSDRGEYVSYFKPVSFATTESTRTTETLDRTIALFKTWLGTLQRYESIESIFQDPIEKRYSEQFYHDFDIVDEDAEYAPFDIHKLLILESHLENVKSFVQENRESFGDIEIVKTIEAECNETIQELTVSPKKKVLRRLADIYAKIVKSGGMSVMKKFIATFSGEVQKQIAKVGVEKLADLVNKHGDDITDIVHKIV